MSVPKLMFNPGDQSGFTPTGTSSFDRINPHAVIRELVQNALDAAVAANRQQAHVRFLMKKVSVKDIPGIKEYRSALEGAIKSHAKLQDDKKLPAQAQEVVGPMQKILGEKSTMVLSVIDNGVGLDKKRMRALLADGISYQPNSSASGAFGNGHVVAIPASDLRYLLYGGITANGKITCSGHTILASRAGNGKGTLSKDGYYVSKLTGIDEDPYVFPKDEEIPKLVKKEIESIRSEWTTGTAVIILGFSRFNLKPFDLWSVISKAVASNFFCSIHQGKLVVETIDETVNKSDCNRLDQSNIGKILEMISDKKRIRGTFLSGSRAYDAYNALKQPPITIKTSKGSVTAHIKRSVEGITRIELCRNGMWITSELPGFHGKLNNHQPFHCVICVEGTGELHRLIRTAEGQLHTELKELKQKKDNKALRSCFDEIRDSILKEIPKLDSVSFSPDDVLTVSGPDGSDDGKGLKPSLFGIPTPVANKPSSGNKLGKKRRKRPARPNPNSKNGGDNQGRSIKPKPDWNRQSLEYEAMAIPTKSRAYGVLIVPKEDFPESELRLVLNESIDETCTEKSKETFVALSDIKIDDKEVPESEMVKDEQEQVVGVLLGNLKKHVGLKVEVEYNLPGDLGISKDQEAMLRVEVKQSTVSKKSKK